MKVVVKVVGRVVDDEIETAMAQDLVVEVQQNGASATLSVRGELDVSTAPDLADLCRSVRAQGARDVVIDLTDTSFLDSSGVRALVGAHLLFNDIGGRMRLSHPSEPVMRLFDITGLTAYFSIDDDRPT